MSTTSNGITFSKGITWLIGISLPIIILALSGVAKLLWDMNSKITKLQSDVSVYGSLSVKNEKDIKDHDNKPAHRESVLNLKALEKRVEKLEEK